MARSQEVKDVDISSKFVRKNSDSISPASSSRPSLSSASASPSVIPVKAEIQVSQSQSVQASKRTRPGSGRKSTFNSDKIYLYIEGHKEVKLKELEAAFSEVSGRTIRRMTESLIKAGKIERVGNPGPTSFYKIKTGTPVLSQGELAANPATPSEPRFYGENEEESVPMPHSPEDYASSLGEEVPQLSYSDTSDIIAL